MNYLKSAWREIVLIIMLLAFIATMIKIFIPIYQDEEVVLQEFTPPAAPKVEYCEPVKEYVLKTDDFLAKEDVIILDLSTFELFKTKETKDKIGYYYRRSGSSKEWYTVFKNK